MPKKTFLIGRPISFNHSPTGRCTRGYIAFDLDESILYFMKDQWRPYGQGIRTEWETYTRLHKNNVRSIATAIAGGDVGPKNDQQRTTTQRFFNKNRSQKVVERVHCRLVTKEVGRSLDKYADSAELFVICSHAFMGEFHIVKSMP